MHIHPHIVHSMSSQNGGRQGAAEPPVETKQNQPAQRHLGGREAHLNNLYIRTHALTHTPHQHNKPPPMDAAVCIALVVEGMDHSRGTAESFTGDLVVKTAERDAERLQAAERPLIVHSEGVLAHAAKLHHYYVGCGEASTRRA